MAFIRNCFLMAVTTLCAINISAQNVSYPAKSSQVLKATAEDVAVLMAKAISGSYFTVTEYATIPSSGIVFIYDSTITNNSACKVESDGNGIVKFSASQDNGLCYGIYQYISQLGFRFYLPGSVWETTPALSSPFIKLDTLYKTNFKYNTWFISGGYSRWIMDNNSNYGWEGYAGENGHNLALYQRRNSMNGEYSFAGHRADIITGANISTWQNNPCYVASFNNSRVVTSQSVPDVNNTAAMQLWASTLEQKYTDTRNSILAYANTNVNRYRNMNYGYGGTNLGIEVTDGANWGNTKDNAACSGSGYDTPADQSIALANFTAQKISTKYPDMRFQIYAYSKHADVPASNIQLSDKIDVQIIPTVYQNISSANGLRNRWYNKTKNVSEYNYMNLSVWSGETPALYMNDFKATLQIAKDKKSQGLVWETSPAKFVSLPFLMAANLNLQKDVPVENFLKEFCNDMFADAGETIYSLLQLWTDENTLAGGISNRYKLPLYFQIVNKAEQQITQQPEIVKQRLRELKAYLHYMVLYYDWSADPRSKEAKADKAAAFCMYLAKTNKLQLVNSYSLVAGMANRFGNGSSFYQQYNVANGTAYDNGNLALITVAEIDNNFRADLAKINGSINKYKFETVDAIASRFNAAGLKASDNVKVQLSYTNGLDNYNRSEFSIKAPSAGTFTINYTPRFDAPDQGYINIVVESTDKALEIAEDFSMDKNAKTGSLVVKLPNAGNYKMTITSTYKSVIELDITTNKNIFYKTGVFFGKTTENYTNNIGMPGYFYVPLGIDKVYFSFANTYSAAGYASAEKITSAFAIQDNNGKPLTARFASSADSVLFYIEIPAESQGKFCRVTKKSNYDLIFSNISNYLWYAEPKPAPCSNADFSIASVNKNGKCSMQLTAVAIQGQFEWTVTDFGKTYTYGNKRVVELPENSSTNAVVTLTNGSGCSFTKTIGEDETYMKLKKICANGGTAMPEAGIIPVVYPNPSTGNFKCTQNGADVIANKILIYNAQGNNLVIFNNVNKFNISNVPAGMYWYKIIVKGAEFSGRLVKL